MLTKRIIGVVTVRDNWAVQSMGYKRYLPLGKPVHLVENLDRWGVDEILLQDISRTVNNQGPNLALIDLIAKKGITTPVMYAGGIRSKQDAVDTIRAGVERICVESILRSKPQEIPEMVASLGSQAVVASLSIKTDKMGKKGWFNFQDKTISDIPTSVYELINDDMISELLLIDADHEGTGQGFDFSVMEVMHSHNIPYIVFGGFQNSEQMEQALKLKNVSALGIGNFLNYQEHKVQTIKSQLIHLPIRKPTFHPYEHDKKICL